MREPKVTPEQAATLVDALRAAFRPSGEPEPGAALDVGLMIAEGRQDLAELNARRQARYDRHAAKRAQAMAAYERAQAEHAARTVPSWNVAAAAWLGPPPAVWIE